jgi:hypothetical protein
VHLQGGEPWNPAQFERQPGFERADTVGPAFEREQRPPVQGSREQTPPVQGSREREPTTGWKRTPEGESALVHRSG